MSKNKIRIFFSFTNDDPTNEKAYRSFDWASFLTMFSNGFGQKENTVKKFV